MSKRPKTTRPATPRLALFALHSQAFRCAILALALSFNSTAATRAEPLLPDLIIWAHQFPNYMYGGALDRNSVKNKVIYKFDNALPNIGAGPLELREVTHPDLTQDVYQRIYQREGGVTETLIGTFANADGPYGHLYLEGIAQYNFRTVVGGNGVGPIVSTHDKVSYALVDSTDYDTSLPGAPQNRVYGNVNAPLLGVSVGWVDIYGRTTKGQWADATGLADGQYWLEVVADPYDRIDESDETNNTTRILVTLTNIPDPIILPGDYNNDRAVNAADYTVWRNTIGATVPLGTGADGDGDGRITGLDLPVWQLHYGDLENGSGALANLVPEPTSASLALMLLLASASFARRVTPRRYMPRANRPHLSRSRRLS